VIAQSYWNAYRADGLVVIDLIAADESGNDPTPEGLAAHASDLGLTYPVLSDQSGFVQRLLEKDGGIPTLVLIAPGMEVVAVDDPSLGYEDIEDVLGL